MQTRSLNHKAKKAPIAPSLRYSPGRSERNLSISINSPTLIWLPSASVLANGMVLRKTAPNIVSCAFGIG